MVRKWETTRAEELTQILDSKVTGICSLSEAPITPPLLIPHTNNTLKSHGYRHKPHLTRLVSLRILRQPLIYGMKGFTRLTGGEKKKAGVFRGKCDALGSPPQYSPHY